MLVIFTSTTWSAAATSPKLQSKSLASISPAKEIELKFDGDPDLFSLFFCFLFVFQPLRNSVTSDGKQFGNEIVVIRIKYTFF